MITGYDKVKVGIIGWGENTLLISDLLIRHTKYIDLYALSTSHQTGRNYAITKLGIKHIFSHHKQMLDLHEIDAVIIAGPIHEHSEQIIDSIAKGYHVLYEMPAALDLTEIIRVIDIVERHPSQICMAAISHRFETKFVKIKDKIEKGEIGNVLAIQIEVCQTTDSRIAEKDVGIVNELLLPYIDLIRWLTNSEFRSVNGFPINQNDENNYCSFFGVMLNDVQVNIIANRVGHHNNGTTIKIVATSGELIVNNTQELPQYSVACNGSLLPFVNNEDSSKRYHKILNGFVSAIQDKRMNKKAVEDLINNTRTMIAFNKSLHQSEPIIVVDENFQNEEEV